MILTTTFTFFRNFANNMNEEIINPEIIESMGISIPAWEEVQCIIGRMPTIEELSTLLAMWESNGKQQSFYGWLKGQPHATNKNEYIYEEKDEIHKQVKEPKVKECIQIAKELFKNKKSFLNATEKTSFKDHGNLIYMVGKVASEFLDSQYAKEHLHIATNHIVLTDETEDESYLNMILEVLFENKITKSICTIEEGGLFGALLAASKTPKSIGFDILTCKEVRLDAFLFGEKKGRQIVSVSETEDDMFLAKLDEAGIDCCFLGRTTKGRIVIDGMDFGDRREYL